jgi:hypothetical protein
MDSMGKSYFTSHPDDPTRLPESAPAEQKYFRPSRATGSLRLGKPRSGPSRGPPLSTLFEEPAPTLEQPSRRSRPVCLLRIRDSSPRRPSQQQTLLCWPVHRPFRPAKAAGRKGDDDASQSRRPRTRQLESPTKRLRSNPRLALLPSRTTNVRGAAHRGRSP